MTRLLDITDLSTGYNGVPVVRHLDLHVDAGEVVALLMGPERAADSLRKALAIGADRAVHVSDEGLAGSDLVATSKALATALERATADPALRARLGEHGVTVQGSSPAALREFLARETAMWGGLVREGNIRPE